MTQLVIQPVKDLNFRTLLVFIALWNFAVNMAGPFFIIYMMKRLELSLSFISILTVTSQITTLYFLRIWGKLADRYSNKSVLGVSCPLFLVAVIGWTFTTMPEKHLLTVPLLFLIQIITGMALAGVNIASVNIALKLSSLV
ncbi:MFS transporter [candidate division CSSED10-310 bacterium]|uniref:MFS transporter n=1 Tax=candidate division CSSED10-310 bacterium TaxID=2855610 RepID=A0ABV6Z1N7_UNCC1